MTEPAYRTAVAYDYDYDQDILVTFTRPAQAGSRFPKHAYVGTWTDWDDDAHELRQGFLAWSSRNDAREPVSYATYAEAKRAALVLIGLDTDDSPG